MALIPILPMFDAGDERRAGYERRERPPMNWKAEIRRRGPITLLALGLTWWLATRVEAKIDHQTSIMYEHVMTSNFFLRAICLNTAETETQRANCIPPEPPREVR